MYNMICELCRKEVEKVETFPPFWEQLFNLCDACWKKAYRHKFNADSERIRSAAAISRPLELTFSTGNQRWKSAAPAAVPPEKANCVPQWRLN